jgi:predicted MFS family arabinose efflux permease
VASSLSRCAGEGRGEGAAAGMKPAIAAAVGFASLAAAMGIGRFAFTPLLPLMQQAYGLSLGQGAWLATANYLGYLVGACACFVRSPAPGAAARWGLAVVVLTTAPMAFTTSFGVWFALRFASGVASALVLVGASTWALSHLAAGGRGRLAGGVFSGVGAGIVIAGIASLIVGGGGARAAWLGLGALATAVAATAWKALGIAATSPAAAPAAAPADEKPARLDRDDWVLVGCYGAFGLGYIVPATFIPALARSLVNDPAVFGWAWPVFGLAATLSTVLTSTVFGRVSPRRVAAGSLLVMAAGVVAPVVSSGLPALLFCAVCVGGTFMVVTMASMQEARRRSSGGSTTLVSAMTAAFALGQLAGPALVGLGTSAESALAGVSLLATAVLLASALVLFVDRARRGGAVQSTR